MSLLKVIMASATVATTLFTGVASDVPVSGSPAGQYAVVPEKDRVFDADSEIYDAVRAALTESFDSGGSALARRFWTADVLMGKDGAMPSERQVLAKKQNSSKNAVANEEKTAVIDSGSGTVDNTGINIVANNSPAETNIVANNSLTETNIVANNSFAETTAGAVGKVNEEAVQVSNTDTSANTSDSKEMSPAVKADNASVNSGSNTPAPAPVVPTTEPAGNPTVADTGSEPAPAPAVPTTEPASEPTAADTGSEPAPAPVVSADNGPKYDHTTSIYTNDESTLLRVEYYDENNKLFEYSSVDNYDKDTNSYTETVYKWDYENDTQVTVRTDTYVNGELTSSDRP